VAIIAFLLPIGLTSCDSGDETKPPTEMKLSVIKSDPVLKSFLSDGNYPNKTLIASFNYKYYFSYGNIGENDSINEPDTPIYNIILKKKYVGIEDALNFKGRYNFTLDYRFKHTYSVISPLDDKTIIWKTLYQKVSINFENKTLLEFITEFMYDKQIKDNPYIYRIDIFAQNR